MQPIRGGFMKVNIDTKVISVVIIVVGVGIVFTLASVLKGRAVDAVTNLAYYAGFISPVFIAFFTCMLWKVTNKYAKVTENLLRQSRESFERNRIAFEADLIGRTVQQAIDMTGNTMTKKQAPGFLIGMCRAIAGEDKQMAKRIIRKLEAWKEINWVVEKALEEIEKKKTG